MKCSQCQKLFSQVRMPVIFPCGHSFCSLCFNEQTLSTCPTCGQEGKVVLNYALYEEVIKNKNNHIQKYIKICLFGNEAVGKSSLIKRIVDDQFQQFVNPTIGIDFRYKDATVENGIYRFQLWDSAGQQKYRSMVSQHLKGSDIIFLVYDLSVMSAQNSLEYWIKEIQNNIQHQNVIIIGNKTDEYRRKGLDKQKFNNISEWERQHIEKQKWKIFQISCKTRQNIDALLQYVVKISRTMKTKAEQKKQSVILSSKMSHNQKGQTYNKGQNKCIC